MVKAVDLAYEVMREAIAVGEVPPGGRIREEEFAERAGVSRTPVREALRRLDADGFVTLNSNRGARVVSWSVHDVSEVFNLRLLLEPHGAARAAEHATDEQIERLDGLAEDMFEAADKDDLEQLTALNNAFHEEVVTASGNRRLVTVTRSLMHLALIHRTFAVYSDEALDRSLRHHRELVVAIRTRDAGWAQSVMTSHVHAGFGQVQAALAAGGSVLTSDDQEADDD